MKITVSINIDTDRISSYASDYLADLWHVAQANPAPFGDKNAGDLIEEIGREIIKRWLKENPGNLYHHQGHHHYWSILVDHGSWVDGVWIYGDPARKVAGNDKEVAPPPVPEWMTR